MPHAKRPTTHKCACSSCAKEIPHAKLACYHHWMRLTVSLQAEIVENWKYGLKYKCHPAPSYMDSIAKARAMWAQQDAALLAKRMTAAMG